jgi:hypothetical protein
MKRKVLLKVSCLLVAFFLGVSPVFMLDEPICLGSSFDGVIIVEPGKLIIDALNNASDGDTIFVKSGTYLESNIVVNKTVKIIGENAESTIIDGEETTEFIFHVIANNVVIENFTLQNTSSSFPPVPAVSLLDVQNVTVQNNTIRNAGCGVRIRSSNYTWILHSRISETVWGIRVSDGSYNNTIFCNMLEKNQKAVDVASLDCQLNKLCHNNFINNTEQVVGIGSNNLFDNGYPSGGNYWSNHVASDLKSGPNQNETGSDGILDEAYPDPVSQWDKYPLVHPIINVEVVADENCFMVQVSTNSTLTGCDFNQSAKSLTLFADGPLNTNGSCRVVVPKELLSSESPCDWTIIIYNGDSGQTVPYWASEDSYSSYFYFVYSHSSVWKIEMVVAENVTLITLILLSVVVTLMIFGKKLKQEKC